METNIFCEITKEKLPFKKFILDKYLTYFENL